MHTELYCQTLKNLDPAKAIRAIQQAYLQLDALAPAAGEAGYDNAPALSALRQCLRDAGHVGFSAQTAGD